MTKTLPLILLLALPLAPLPATGQSEQPAFEQFFTTETMRFDFQHAGDATSEAWYAQELCLEGPWAGPRQRLVSPFPYGEQMLEIADLATGRVIYRTGYCTLFNEWQTTDEARHTRRAMAESVVFPRPKADFRIILSSRLNPEREMRRMYSHTVKADDYNIRPFAQPACEVEPLHLGTGEPRRDLDIVILPEGYAAHEREKFLSAARAMADTLLACPPFDSLASRMSLRAVWMPGARSGVSQPGRGEWVGSLLGARFHTLDSERYLMTEHFQRVRDVAAAAPYDRILILANTDKYGGGGIFNYYAIGAAHNAKRGPRVLIHELAHHLMGLGDEYVEPGNTTSALYPPGVEPWEANLTTRTRFAGKWERMIKPGTPQPTPLPPAGTPRSRWEVGLYEGGGYLERGVWRPFPKCMMSDLSPFCPACREAITRYVGVLCDD